MTACVAMTGCPGERDVEFTILSQHNAGYHMYRWNKDGTIEGVESEKRVDRMLKERDNLDSFFLFSILLS